MEQNHSAEGQQKYHLTSCVDLYETLSVLQRSLIKSFRIIFHVNGYTISPGCLCRPPCLLLINKTCL